MEIPDNVANCPAILATILHTFDAPQLHFGGDGSWHPLLQGALLLMSYTEAPSIRVTVDAHTLVIQREGTTLIGIVIKTGDPIGKSLHRMLSRTLSPGKRGPKPKVEAATEAPQIGGGL